MSISRPVSLGAILLILLLVATAAIANMAAPLRPGVALGEPDAALDSLIVERERLEIDLRPLALDAEVAGHALVSATYEIRNDGAARIVTLDFVAASLDTARWSVFVDGERIGSRYLTSDSAIAGHTPPSTTPGLDGEPLEYEADVPGIIRFEAPIGAGRHTIRVEYVARATEQVTDHPLRNWQLAYILSPARRWPSFGTLEVTMHLPHGWDAATEPSLERSGDVLHGSFNGIPADVIAITARGAYRWWYGALAWLPALVALVLGGVAALRLGSTVGRWIVRGGRSRAWAIPAAIGSAFVLGVGIPVVGLLGQSIEDSLVGAHQRAWGGYTFVFYEILLAMIAFLVGLIVVQWGAYAAVRRGRRRYDPRWSDGYEEASHAPAASAGERSDVSGS